MLPEAIVPDGPERGLVRVKKTMQVAVPGSLSDKTATPPSELSSGRDLCVPYPHIFAIGDAADAFGAIKAGHTAGHQAEVAARNIIRLIQQAELGSKYDSARDTDLQLEHYTPGAPGIKISLGLSRTAYQLEGVVGTKVDEPVDMNAYVMWQFYGVKPDEAVNLVPPRRDEKA
ncbi:hypothetical protein AcV5_010220 [Taiwanofungus camphoratus]|nr:hypothetical protein AcV5_010220 [Antrodia cinnamomea]